MFSLQGLFYNQKVILHFYTFSLSLTLSLSLLFSEAFQGLCLVRQNSVTQPFLHHIPTKAL